MIALFTNTGLQLDLPTGKLTFELNFPGLDPESLIQSFTFASTFPPSSNNDKAFGSARLIYIPKKIKEIDVDVYLSGSFWRKAKIIFSEAGSDGYRGSIILDEVFVDQVNRSLKEIDFGKPIALGLTTSERVSSAKGLSLLHGYKGPENPCTFFPVYNPWFYGGAPAGQEGFGEGPNPDFAGIINEFNAEAVLEAGRTFYHNEIPANANNPMNKHCLVPFLYHHFILDKIFLQYNVNLTGSFWFDDEARTAVLYNNYPLDFKRRRNYIHVSWIPDQQFILPGNQSFQDVDLFINSVEDEDLDGMFYAPASVYTAINTGTYKIKVSGLAFGFQNDTNNPAEFPGEIRTQSQGPNLTTFDLIAENWQFFGDENGHYFEAEALISVIEPNSQISIQARCTAALGYIVVEWGTLSIENLLANDLNEYSSEIIPSNHVPDVPISTYLNELRKIFGFTFIFDPITRQLNLDFVDDYLDGGRRTAIPVKTSKTITKRFREAKSLKYKYDWNSADDGLTEGNFKPLDGLNYKGVAFTLADPKEKDCILRPDTGQIQVYSNGAFRYYTDYYPEQTFGNYPEITEVNLMMTPLMTWNIIPYGTGQLTMPAVKQEADSPAFELSNPLKALRTTFYRGYIQGIAPAPDVRTVPSGSSFARDQYGNAIGNTALSLNDCDAPGVIQRYLQRLINLKVLSDLVITRVGLTLDQILALSWKDRWLIQSTHMIPVKLTFETSPNKLSEIEAELYTDFSGYDGES